MRERNRLPFGHPVPFTIDVPQSILDGIQRKVRAYEWHEMPEIQQGADRWAYGADMRYIRELCAYWLDVYDWRAAEAVLNRYQQYIVRIDDQDVHFLHVRGSGGGTLAVMLTHGWPGSFYEFYAVIDRLTRPDVDPASGGLDVIVPSLPGFAFSGKPKRPIGPRRISALWDTLARDVLGYERYIAQGGDWGSYVSGWLGYEHGPAQSGGCVALHLNMYGVRTAEAPSTDDARAWADRIRSLRERESAYSHLQATKPQSLSYGMMDSPVGVLAWIIEKFNTWSDLRGPDRGEHLENAFSKDQLLTNVMVYLVTRSFNTASWIYRGRLDEGGTTLAPGTKVVVPTAVANFAREPFLFPPRSYAERSYNIVRWTDHERGGHFAAMEQPEAFALDVRASVGELGLAST
jgi:pimeloyl-ACP methyl ester carboxylesterase